MSGPVQRMKLRVCEIMETVRDQTAEKVRRREFAGRMTPEEHRRAEAALATFTEAMDRAIGTFSEEEPDEDWGFPVGVCPDCGAEWWRDAAEPPHGLSTRLRHYNDCPRRAES